MIEWAGDNPYYLLIIGEDIASIDLDQRGWAETFSAHMRQSGHWHLVAKSTARPVLTVVVHDGEQPYYTARHVGIAGSGGSNEVVAYGIGKKQNDGSMVRLWVMPDGTVTGGDDVSTYGVSMVKAIGPKVVPPQP